MSNRQRICSRREKTKRKWQSNSAWLLVAFCCLDFRRSALQAKHTYAKHTYAKHTYAKHTYGGLPADGLNEVVAKTPDDWAATSTQQT